MPEHERSETWRLVQTDGRVTGRGRGGVELLRSLSAARPAGQVLALVPDRVLDGAYAVLARLRGPLGRLVPDGPGPRRFP